MIRTKGSRFIAMLLAVIMVFSAMPMTALTARASTTFNNTAEFMDGKGTKEDPYLISNKAHLNNVRKYPHAYFLMVTDIAFSDADFQENGEFYNEGKGWLPIGSAQTPFTGVFDGNGHVIKGLRIDYRGVDCEVSITEQAGLFGVNNGIIKNLTMKDGSEDFLCSTPIFGTTTPICLLYVGGIAGINNGQIINCINENPVSLAADFGKSSTLYVGGIAAYNTGSIQNCVNRAVLNSDSSNRSVGIATSYVGGISGYSEGNVTCCSNLADFTAKGTTRDGNGYFGAGIVGYNQGGQIKDCYNTGKFGDRIYAGWNYTGYAGGITGYNAEGTIQNVYNIGLILENIVYYSSSTVLNVHYGGAICGGNSGIATNCYYLEIADIGIGTGTGNATKFNANQIGHQETFQGFDFANTWIIGTDSGLPPVLQANPLQIVAPQENTAEFAGGTGAAWNPFRITTKEHLDHIRNYPDAFYVLENDIDGTGLQPIEDFKGIFDGKGYSISSLTNPLFGKNYGIVKNVTLDNCQITAQSTPELIPNLNSWSSYYDYHGFMAQHNYGAIRRCTVNGMLECHVNLKKVNKQDEEGYGYSGSSMATGSYTYIGGFVASNRGVIEDCKSSVAMKFTGNTHIESVVPTAYTGSQTLNASIESYVGGIVAKNGGTVLNSIFDGTIDFDIDTYLSGTNSSVRKATCKTSNFDYAGGVAATNSGMITGCVNKGALTIDTQMDGTYKTSIGNAYNYIGGIVGKNSNTVKNSYHAGSLAISGKNTTYTNTFEVYAAGVADSGTVDNCYSIDEMDISVLNATVSKKIVGGTSGSGQVGIDNFTLEQMQTSLPYELFDFEDIWCFDTANGYLYPQLRWQIPEAVEVCISAKPLSPIETLQGIFPDLTGISVQLRYKDGSVKIVPAALGMLQDFDVNKVGTQVLHIENGGVVSADTLTVVVHEPTPVSISVSELPAKLEYYIGTSKPDLTNGKIEILYNNGTTQRIAMTADMISGFNSTAAGNRTLTVTYAEKTTTFDVLIYKVASISIAANPSKLSYVQGQPLNVSGGTITVEYTNGTSQTVSLTSEMVTYSDTETGSVWLTVTYEGEKTGFYITVNPRQIQSIRMVEPNKLSYIVGEELDLSGGYFRVTFVSDDSYFEDVPMEQEMISGYDNQIPGFQTLTATYESYSANLVVRVVEKNIISLKIHTLPEKLVFRGGLDTLDTTGGQLYIRYEDGTEEIMTILPEMVTNFDNTVAGKQKLTVAYKNYTVSYEVEIIKATVEFRNADGTVLSSAQYLWGETVTVPANPTKAADNTYTYTFTGWDKDVVDCAGNATYTATFEPVYIDYAVTFQYDDGTVIEEKTYHYGEQVVAPAAPAVPESLGENYEFRGWDKEVTNCQGSVTYTAVFGVAYVPGDLDGVEGVTDADAVYLLYHTFVPDLYPVDQDCDFNGDGEVNDGDAVYLLYYTFLPDLYPIS